MRKTTVQLALFFITLIFISSTFSFFISNVFTFNIENEIKTSEEAIAKSIFELREKTDLTIEEIISITSTPTYHIQKIEEEELKQIKEDIEKVYRDENMFYYHNKLSRPTIILNIEDDFIQISLHPENTMFKIVTSRIWLSLLSYFGVGILLISIFTRSITKPILRLNEATKEVARGNFDVQIQIKSTDEIGQLTENFNKMTRELKNIDYLRKDFISNVSHEFKTPIASIQGFAKLLQNKNLSEVERQEYADIIVEETNRLSNLSSNILKLSKLENQEIIEEGHIYSLDEQIRKSILLLEHQWSEKDIEFDLNLEKTNYLGNEELMQQVWINLLNNAIKYSSKNSVISIRLEKINSKAKIEIVDQGIGMTQETIERIFEKFYQEDKSHSQRGNGLGLPLVKKILDLYGGNISVESSKGEGSTFTVELPLQ